MARRPNDEILYTAFKDFLNRCILGNQSLLCPNKESWTRENVTDVKRRMVDSPLFGSDLSFEQKLLEQMKGASPEQWIIICDIYYVYFLPSTHISFDKKERDIRWAAEQGGVALAPSDPQLCEALKFGFTRTAQRYHQKYRQFWLILDFSYQLKTIENPQEVITSPQIMQHTLDLILDNMPNKADRAYDMRHAMLYMAFPEQYERIISSRDKRRIVEVYRKQIKGEIPSDIDEAIRRVRNALSTQFQNLNRPFDFYQDIKAEWRPQGEKAQTVTVTADNRAVIVPQDEEAEREPPVSSRETTMHTEIQWKLLKLGNDMGLDVWVARNDRNREIGGNRFADLSRFKKELPLQFDDATNRTIELIDVIWLKGNAIVAAFEIESTTSIYSGILRLADLISMQPNLNIPLYLVAPDERKSKVISEVNRPVFSHLSPPMSELCRFISFSALTDKISHVSSVVKYLKPDFLEELSESCEIEEEQD
jgi:hypothetical protein